MIFVIKIDLVLNVGSERSGNFVRWGNFFSEIFCCGWLELEGV